MKATLMRSHPKGAHSFLHTRRGWPAACHSYVRSPCQCLASFGDKFPYFKYTIQSNLNQACNFSVHVRHYQIVLCRVVPTHAYQGFSCDTVFTA